MQPGAGLEAFKRYAADVERLAAGRWGSIYGSLAPETKPALDRLGHHTFCPSHVGKNGDAFRFIKEGNKFHDHGSCVCNTCGYFKSGFKALQWMRGWDYGQAVKEVGAFLGQPWERNYQRAPIAPRALPPPVEKPAMDPKKALEFQERLDLAIRQASPVDFKTRNPATLYFMKRGLDQILRDPPSDLFLHPGMLWSKQTVGPNGKSQIERHGRWPTLLAIVRDPSGKMLGIHRTYLTPDGSKAPVPEAKKLMRSPHDLSGGAVHLYPATDTLCAAEGLETTLAVRAAHWDAGIQVPVWAGLNTSLLGSMVIPESVRKVYIYGDNDAPPQNGLPAGLKAAQRLESRASKGDRQIKIFLPPRVDTDWLDEYLVGRRSARFQPAWGKTEAETPAQESEEDDGASRLLKQA